MINYCRCRNLKVTCYTQYYKIYEIDNHHLSGYKLLYTDIIDREKAKLFRCESCDDVLIMSRHINKNNSTLQIPA